MKLTWRYRPGQPHRGWVLGLTTLFLWTVLGTVGFASIEGWPLADALYMTIITISTVGYNEVHPLSGLGRLFAVFLIVGGLGTAVYTLTRLGQVVLEGELLGRLGGRRMRKALSGLEGHYIVCGFGRFARPVAEALAHKGLLFCIIEQDASAEAQLSERRYLYLIADATSDEALDAAGIRRASAVLTLLPSDADNLYVTVTAKSLNPEVRVIARASDQRGEQKLLRGGANVVISPYNLTSHRILQATVSPTVLQFMEQISDLHYLEMNLGEVQVEEGSALAGRSIGAAKLRSELGVIVVAIKHGGGALRFNPGPDEKLHPGDVLVVMGHEENLDAAKRALGRA